MPCPHRMSEDAEQSIDNINNEVFERCRRTRSNLLSQSVLCSNAGRVIRLAFKLFKSGNVSALPTDKDAGYAIMPRDQVMAMKSNLISSSSYEECVLVESEIASMLNRYRTLCQQAASSMRTDTVHAYVYVCLSIYM